MSFPSAIGCFVVGRSPIETGGPCLPEQGTLQKIILAYLYWQYRDDSDLQAFVDAYNELTQEFLDWFNGLNLPIYTGGVVAGALLDWVAEGLYGLKRPVLGNGRLSVKGPYNTFAYNESIGGFNGLKFLEKVTYDPVTDDIFRRIITWRFSKAYGRVFNVRWLKRRIMQFLLGTNGVNFNVDQTYPISVTFGYDNQINITLVTFSTKVLSGAIYNTSAYNTTNLGFNTLNTISTRIRDQFPLAQVLKDGIDNGALELPFQYDYIVTIQP